MLWTTIKYQSFDNKLYVFCNYYYFVIIIIDINLNLNYLKLNNK